MVFKEVIWVLNIVKDLHGVGVWRNIRNGWFKFASFTREEVGDGAWGLVLEGLLDR